MNSVKVSLGHVVEDEEKLLAVALVSSFCQADLESLDWTGQVILRHAQS